jgi:putative addiction module component (TIGR02574 family)
MRAAQIPNFEKLSDLERIALAEEILGSLRAPEALPSPVAHAVELDRRWAAYQANPAIAVSKAEFGSRVASGVSRVRARCP